MQDKDYAVSCGWLISLNDGQFETLWLLALIGVFCDTKLPSCYLRVMHLAGCGSND